MSATQSQNSLSEGTIESDRSFWGSLKLLFSPLKEIRPDAVKISLFDGISTGFLLLMIYGAQYVIQALEKGDMELMMIWIWIITGGSIIAFLFRTFVKPFVFNMPRSLGDYLDKVYMKKIIYGDNNVYEGIGVGRMIAVFEKGMYTRVDFYRNIFGEYIATLVTVIAFFVTLYSKAVHLFRMMGIAVIIMSIWFSAFGGLPYYRRKFAKDSWTDVVRTKIKWFMSKNEIMQSNQLSKELFKKESINKNRYEFKFKEKRSQGIAFDGAMLILTLMFVYILYSTGMKVSEGTFSYSDAVIIVGLGTTFLGHIQAVLKNIRVSVDNRIHLQKMRELVDSLDCGVDIELGKTYKYKKGNIQIEKLNFGYSKSGKHLQNGDTQVLADGVFKEFELYIPGGSKTALVGPSGSGKTTLVKLIAGYLRPDSGTIYIDDQNLPNGSGGESDDHISLKSYYTHIGYLTQEPSVFDGTVRENLIYAVGEDISSDLIDQAIIDSSCEFIYDLPNGLNTEIGERGVRLSGGQRQRLAIAKIFLKNPKIIILDEPTSALDSESEEAVTQAMNRLFEGRTVIIIAHRLQTVKHADNIIYLDNGQIVEQGTHEDLMQQEGKYFRMVELQSGF